MVANIKHIKVTLYLVIAFFLQFILGLLIIFLLYFSEGINQGIIKIFFSLILVVNISIIYFFVAKIFYPLKRLISETQEVLVGKRLEQISSLSNNELGILADNFNQLIFKFRKQQEKLAVSNSELLTKTELVQKTYRTLDKKVHELSTLLKVSKELSSTLDLDTIMQITAFTFMGQLTITSMAIMLLKGNSVSEIEVMYTKGLGEKLSATRTFEFNPEFFNLLKKKERPFLISVLENEKEFKQELEILYKYKTVILIPLIVKNKIMGVVLLGKKLSGEEYAEQEQIFMSSLSSLTALAIKNALHHEQAITDYMTGLYIKRYFEQRFEIEIKRNIRYGGKTTLLLLDVDYFKKINDEFGHTRGDEVLMRLAKLIKENFREVDVPARYGGEEFAVIMPAVSKEDAFIAAERLRKNIAQEVLLMKGKKITVTASMGLAEFPKDAKTLLQMIEAADTALYKAKNNGRNQIVLA